jgi:uncharacterized membrane protein
VLLRTGFDKGNDVTSLFQASALFIVASGYPLAYNEIPRGVIRGMLPMKNLKLIIYLFMLTAIALFCLGSPAVLVAQEGKQDLSLRLLYDYYYKEVTRGKDNAMFMEIRNYGTNEVNNIRFISNTPTGWLVEFNPESLDRLGAGSSHTVDIKVVPPSRADKGDYNLTFIAEADETRTATSTMLRIEGGTSIWLWVGVGVGVLILAGFVFVFLKFGRQ